MGGWLSVFRTPSVGCFLCSQVPNDISISRAGGWRWAEPGCWYSPCGTHPLCSPWSSHQTAVEIDREQEIKGDGRAAGDGRKQKTLGLAGKYLEPRWWGDSWKCCRLLLLIIDTRRFLFFFKQNWHDASFVLICYRDFTHSISAPSHVQIQIGFKIDVQDRHKCVVKHSKNIWNRLSEQGL